MFFEFINKFMFVLDNLKKLIFLMFFFININFVIMLRNGCFKKKINKLIIWNL